MLPNPDFGYCVRQAVTAHFYPLGKGNGKISAELESETKLREKLRKQVPRVRLKGNQGENKRIRLMVPFLSLLVLIPVLLIGI